ncbi:hypothetical protein IHE49_00025 [Rhodanobacter sp. 7MK24]|uniref:hypothetical protein n=1 Tax=Rhodanobacter sp. 7MK24 TaxID=2775922 RepID=UPI00177E1029|nr:hypothetical protein [Rhodanobacter sp. 7MK24]MBD8878860.1 hypothetical protein [Rhodanobacter sp. 7MK24]
MHTREEAIEWLRKKGFHAAARDWSLGKTVCVGAGPISNLGSSITAFRHMIYIYPESEQWSISDWSSQSAVIKMCGSLENAALEAANALTKKLADDAATHPTEA